MKATEHIRATVLVRTTQTKGGCYGVTLHKDVHHKRTARDGAGEDRRNEQRKDDEWMLVGEKTK